MQSELPLSREIVLIGGGHAHALLLRRWGMDPLPGARLTLINPAATAPYTGMLPGFVAGHYPRKALEIDLVRLARFAGARMVFGEVSGLDRENRRVFIDGRAPLAYDFASFDIGITSDMPDLPGFKDHGIAAKPLGPFAVRWRSFLDQGGGPVIVIGGGVAGVELALAMGHALSEGQGVKVIEADTALQGIGTSTRDRLLSALEAAKVELIENTTVTRVAPDHIELSNSSSLPSALTVGAAGARPFSWLAETGLELHAGYIAVDRTLRSLNDPTIFAVGDCAHLSHAPRPKAGVFAVRAAPALTRNLKAAAAGKPLSTFHPQTHYLKLVSLGGQTAIADKWGRSIEGDWVWRWKDRIDRTFMDKLNDLPRMRQTSLPSLRATGMTEALGPKPLCGGCGAKLGSDILGNVLATLPPHCRTDVLTSVGDDAAVLDIGGKHQVVTTDHLRAFWDDPWVMGRITALHALGDIWAMGAAPQSALAHITLPRMARHMQESWLHEVMASAAEVFDAEGAAIVGGHSTLGAELVVGFSLTGLLKDRAVTLAGAREGDVLLLTRPIGSGTLFAAEMELKAKGNDVFNALTMMSRSQGDAARVLAPVANAMTDVTGFGLAGHAAGIARASNLSVRINLDSLSVYPGAETLAAEGVRSSIWQSNQAAVSSRLPDTPRATLLFDPQTAGGLLAAVPADLAMAVIAPLRDLGHDAHIVGEMVAPGDVLIEATTEV